MKITQSQARYAFWEKISILATRELERPVENPNLMVQRMLDEYNTLLSVQAKETGTAQPDGEYEQTMALWKERVDSVNL